MSPSGGGKGDDAYFVQGTFLDYIWNTYPGDVAQALAVAWHIRKTLPEQMDRPKLQTLSTTPPPSRNSNRGGGEDVTGLPGTQASTRQSLRRKTYDIPTLLSLRHAQGPWPVLLRVKPEAIAGKRGVTVYKRRLADHGLQENIFQYMGARTIQRLSGRPHCLSEVSNGTHFDIKLVDNIPHRPSNGPKSTSTNKSHRQVPLPLDIPCSQRNDGFVRFLQRHASPPHHRVTAGGRIVPAGPLSPPPMLDYASLNTFVRERAAAVDDLQNEDHGVQSNTRAHSADTKTNPRTMPYNYRSIQGGGMTGQTTYPMGSAQPVTAHDSFTYSYQPFLSGSMQAPAGMLPIGTFPDGSTLVSYDGLTYRTYWNGLNTVVEPLQSFQQPIGPAYYSAVHPQIPSNISSFNLPPPSQRASRISAPLTNITSGSRGSNEQVSEVMANQSSADKETELKSQLTNLDKHLALYHYEISQAERAEFITQRRYLVETIDKIRVAKEESTRSIPIIAPTAGLPVTPLHGKKFDGNVPKLSALQAAGSKSRVGGKGLSPAAAPFIPSKFRNASSEKSTKRTLEDVANAAIARKSKALNVPDSSGSTQVKSRTEGSTSSGLDPSDPAMRVIDHEDIEYAGRYLYNWDLEQKRYCTTIAEFQEAVRQVREQARRYGCLGGQSKDPAYDAEQDIWWAICDRDPIPLPPAIPDYITIPRQWNWEDSIFNFRRKGAPLAGREIEDARNSPRLVGWDTALTESMKDRIDVTRSYFASKGQLPSVPFRTWNYDLKGNKIEVDSNTGSASQAFRSPDDTEQNVTKDPVTTPSRTLKTLTKNDVNSRENSPRVPSRSQGGRKMYATEGDDLSQMKCYVQDGLRPLSPPSTSNAGFERSMQIRLGKVGVDHSEESNHSITPSRSRQLHVQNCPETPTPHRSNGRPKNILTNNNRLNDTSPTAGWKPVKDGAGNEIIIESTLDPIWDGQYPIYDSRNPNYAKFSSLARKNKFAKAQADVDLEANALPSGHYSFFDHPEDFHPDLNNAEKIKTAKVDLPPANELSPSLGHHHDLPNTSSISITK